MGFKLSILMGVALLALSGAFKLYYDKSEAEKEAMATQLQQAMNNQQLLENTVAQQNADLESALENQQKTQARILTLTTESQQANERVEELRSKFAEHDLDMLSLRKPGLVEVMVNRGTARVGKELGELTDPNQFDEEPDDTDRTDAS